MLTNKWYSRFFALATLMVLVLAAGCSDDPADPQVDPFSITGTVTDTSGNPVAGALILLDLSFENSLKATSVVSFGLPESDHVRIDLMNWCRDEIYMTKEMDLPAGLHSTTIESIDTDGRQLTDQAMWVLLTTSAGVDELRIMLLRNAEGEAGDYIQWSYAYVLDHVRIQATTDSDGRYEIVDPCLGLGEDVSGGSFSWRVRAWAYHADHVEGTPSTWTSLDQNTGGAADIVIQ